MKKVYCLGGAGKICGEAIRDLAAYTTAEEVSQIVVADVNLAVAQALVEEIGDPRLSAESADLFQEEATIARMREFDFVMDGTTIKLNDRSTRCIAKAGCSGINLNGFGEEYKYTDLFAQNDQVHIPGFGMTPGTTNLMAKYAVDPMERIDAIRISHGAYRPFAFSPSIAETTSYEYDPQLPGRVVWEDGQMVQVPPFARPREIELPAPYGANPQYIIPHAETVTLAEYLKDKPAGLIEVRGTWPQQNMRLVRALFDYGFLRNDPIEINGASVGIMDCIAKYLCQSVEGTTTELYGYSLHVEVEGTEGGRQVRKTLWHTHPASDGSVEGWAGLRAYIRNVGIPLGIAVKLMALGKVQGTGCVIPEKAFEPMDLFEELQLRGLEIHERVEVLLDGQWVLESQDRIVKEAMDPSIAQ